MDATQSGLNVIFVLLGLLACFSPFILIALLVGSIRKNNAKRRAAEQERQADLFAEAMSKIRSATQQPYKRPTQDPQRKPWYLR